MNVRLAVAVAAVLAVGCSGKDGEQGPPGPSVKVTTANGDVIGPLVGEPVTQNAYFSLMPVYVEAFGKIGSLSQSTGRFLNCRAVFESADCSGAPFMDGDLAVDEVCDLTSRIFTVPTATPVMVTAASYRNSGGCVAQDLGTVYAWTSTQVFDARYPYTAPLQIVYE